MRACGHVSEIGNTCTRLAGHEGGHYGAPAQKIRVVGAVAYIALKGGEVTIFDAADVDIVAQYRWHASREDHTSYAATNVRKPGGQFTRLKLHRLLLDPPPGMHVDHKNANGLDNRRENISVVTPTANSQRLQTNTSGFVGVRLRKGCSKWLAQIKISGRTRHLGYFTDPLAAAKTYDAAVLRYHPPGSLLNFPDAQPARAELDLAGGEQ